MPFLEAEIRPPRGLARVALLAYLTVFWGVVVFCLGGAVLFALAAMTGLTVP